MEQPTSDDRALTLDEAVSLALVLQQAEQWAAAADIYRSVLEVAPDHAAAVHFSGVLAHQQARSEEALTLIERSLELEPERADWYSNLGIVLQDRLRLDEAIAAYRRAIQLDRYHANAHSNLGVVLRAKGEVVEAEASYRVAVRIDPAHSDAYHNLGVLLNAEKRPREAALCFSKVITLRPKHPEARRLLGIAHCTLVRWTGRSRSSRNGWKRIPRIRLLVTCSRRARAATSRLAHRTRSSSRPSTASPRASTRSWPSCRTERRCS